MGRKRDHYEPKTQHPLMLPSTIAVWLEIYGEGSISLGIVELVRRATDVDSLYPEELRKEFPYLPQVAASHEVRKADADHGARWAEGTDRAPRVLKVGANRRPSETEDERRARIKRNTEIALEAQQEVHQQRTDAVRRREEMAARHDFEANVKYCMECNQAAYDRGDPLPDHVFFLSGDKRAYAVYEEVLKRSRAKFGWDKGPKPSDVSAPHYRDRGAPTASVAAQPTRVLRDGPTGTVTVDYSDVFDAPPAREPDHEALERETAVRIADDGELEGVHPMVDYTPSAPLPELKTGAEEDDIYTAIAKFRNEQSQLSTAAPASADDPDKIAADEIGEPDF